MAPNRTSHTEVPSTPYNRPKQFDTARLLFKRSEYIPSLTLAELSLTL
jgi:hypothetical protein